MHLYISLKLVWPVLAGSSLSKALSECKSLSMLGFGLQVRLAGAWRRIFSDFINRRAQALNEYR